MNGVKSIVPLRLLMGLLICLLAWPAAAEQAEERRIALVIGEAAYPGAELATAANDAGLIAEQLQAAGFDVSGARDLDGDALRQAFRDFVDKAREAGPGSVAMVYFAGYGLQFEGENYVVPVDAKIPTAADVPIEAVRVSDLTRALAELPMKARIVVLDAARENPFARQGQPVASGLALVEPDPGLLVAFNAAPGTVAPAEKAGDAYGAYARALAEMIREGGAPLNDIFDQVRLRVSDSTKGAVVPWDANRVEADFMFFDRGPGAPAPPSAGLSALRERPLKELGPDEAYQAALDRDTIPAYQDYLAAYPHGREARRVRAILAARREALIWRRTLENGTAEGYWSYLRLYPRGPHAFECRRWLSRLAAASEPPPDFQPFDYDLPPPPPDEIVIVDQPVLTFADPLFDLPPPPPVVVLAPPPVYIVDLPPPPPPEDLFVLPFPVFVPLPIFITRPVHCAPPPVSVIAYNIHNTVIVNQNTVVVKDPAGQPVPPLANAIAAGRLPPGAALPSGQAVERGAPPRPAGAGLPNAPALAALHVALPPSVAARARQSSPAAIGAHGNIPRAGVGANAPLPANVPSAIPAGHPAGLTGHTLPGPPAAPPLPGRPAQPPRRGRVSPRSGRFLKRRRLRRPRQGRGKFGASSLSSSARRRWRRPGRVSLRSGRFRKRRRFSPAPGKSGASSLSSSARGNSSKRPSRLNGRCRLKGSRNACSSWSSNARSSFSNSGRSRRSSGLSRWSSSGPSNSSNSARSTFSNSGRSNFSSSKRLSRWSSNAPSNFSNSGRSRRSSGLSRWSSSGPNSSSSSAPSSSSSSGRSSPNRCRCGRWSSNARSSFSNFSSSGRSRRSRCSSGRSRCSSSAPSSFSSSGRCKCARRRMRPQGLAGNPVCPRANSPATSAPRLNGEARPAPPA